MSNKNKTFMVVWMKDTTDGSLTCESDWTVYDEYNERAAHTKYARLVDDGAYSVTLIDSEKGFLKSTDYAVIPNEHNTREECIQWLCNNDPNGCYTDEDCLAEGQDPVTKEEALEIIEDQCNG